MSSIREKRSAAADAVGIVLLLASWKAAAHACEAILTPTSHQLRQCWCGVSFAGMRGEALECVQLAAAFVSSQLAGCNVPGNHA